MVLGLGFGSEFGWFMGLGYGFGSGVGYGFGSGLWFRVMVLGLGYGLGSGLSACERESWEITSGKRAGLENSGHEK